MATRDAARAAEAILKLEAENLGDGSVQFIQLDLSDPRAVSRVAKEFLEKENRLDILSKSPWIDKWLYSRTW